MAAAYAALVSLSHIIHQILNPPPAHQFSIPRELIESLQEEVSSSITFLEKYSRRRSQELEDLEKRIVDAAHEGEDILELDVVSQIQHRREEMMTSTQEKKSSSLSIQKVLEKKKMLQDLPKVIGDFISINRELAQIIYSEGGNEGMRTETSTRASSSRSLPSGNDVMEGFDEHLDQIRSALVSDELDLKVVSVVGMGGIGKTTLATNVYKDRCIAEHFDICAWISLSQDYIVKEVILALLQQTETDPSDVDKSGDDLGTLLHKQLWKRRYLIVMDDVWDIKAWDILRRSFPNNSNGSRILVTTRLLNLAEDFKSCRPYEIGLLDEGSSWNLILDKVFGKEGSCPTELEKIGRSIARQCGGLPLALVVIGGLLAKSEKTTDFWKYVEENVTSAANNNDSGENWTSILSLSYQELPVHLKPCFLYLVVFPKTLFEIRMSRLIRLWVAEGFIKHSNNGKSLEEVAEGHLKDLVDRNLVIVSKRGSTGKVKNCRIHDIIRDLCMREAHKNKFLCVARLDDYPNISPQLESERRISIHTGTTEEKVFDVFLSSTVVLNRSFLSYSNWDSRRCVADRQNLLRVLDAVDPYSIDEIERLVNSRYIACSIPHDQFHVSSFISLLWNVQTVVFSVSISLPSEFWEMSQLRHIKVPGITIPDPQNVECVVVLEHLQTLSTVKDFVFKENIIRRIRNVKKMGIDCEVSKEVGSFGLSNLVLLDKLETLVLAFRGTWQNMEFPVSLKKLTLSHCEIPWEDMYIVGSLPNLEALKLQTRAAKGRMWNPNEGEFRRLKSLLINQCELEIWGADDTHFPSLEHLQLIGMRIDEIPIDFAQILKLETIDLNHCSRSLLASAKRMSKERENLGYDLLHIRSLDSVDAAKEIDFLLESLEQLMIHHARLIHSIKHELESLAMDLRLLKDFSLNTELGDIRGIVREAQDIIDVFVTQTAEMKNSNYFVRVLHPVKIINFGVIGMKIKAIMEKIDIYRDTGSISNLSYVRVDSQYRVPRVRETIVVGFEDEVEIVKVYLYKETQELDVVSIIGIPGLGKTTLAGKIFHDPEIQDEFPTRIWVYVSQEFTKKCVFLAILKEFTTLTDDIKSRTDEEIAELVVGYLENRKFLLVMDDIWCREDWDNLCMALPKWNEKGKVLITSREEKVGWHVNPQRGPYMLRFLTPEESCLLLQLEVFGEPEFPPGLEDEGMEIAESCGGLPLAIVVLAGTLVNTFSPDMSFMQKHWEILSKSFNIYLNDEEVEKRMEKIILLSYDKLPDHLRECFFYFGMFPKYSEIPAWKLICLWIAEGLIQQKDDVTLEETAENYLEELINRNLIRAEKIKPDGKVKTCRIHDMLRDFCLSEAGIKGEGFLQEIKMSSDGGFHPSSSDELKYRRLCIHSNSLNFVSRKPYGPSVRSFVCFSRDEVTMPLEYISAIPGGFKLLRVLDVEPIKFTKLPGDMYHLLHLRYLVLSISSKVLPSAFSKLWNIQTLVVGTDSRTLDVKADILNMTQLRHFKTNASATLPKASKSSNGAGEKIQTLGTIAPKSCTKDVFDRAHNLKKLGVRGKLALLLHKKSGSFESLGKLSNLEKLKLQNDVYPLPPWEGRLHVLPPAYKFPPKLKSLTLSETYLDWVHMSIIGSLENLEVLKLKDNAFQGEIWEATDGGFRRLQVLYIGRTNLKIWLASHYHFPSLKHLQLNNCEDFQQLPIELADVQSFLKLDLFRSKQAVASAKDIEAKINQDNLQPDNVERPFRLSIFSHEK